jgi:O-antigen/teichoic acid export membrane protein
VDLPDVDEPGAIVGPPPSRPADGPAVPVAVPSSGRATDRHLRGSSLLLVGRVLAMGVNFAVQILLARYLSRTDYGAFAYALSFVTLGETITTAGLDRGLSRFLAIYDERRDFARLFGTLALVAGTVLSIGLAVVLVVIGLQGWVLGTLVSDPQAVTLLAILIVLAPIQAADTLLTGVLAVFASARSIFFRRYVLAPGLRLVVVLLLIANQSDVTFLATGYVLAGAAGVAIYVGILWQTLRKRGVLAEFRPAGMVVPWREIFGFTLPLLTTDLVYLVMNTTDAILLGHFSGVDAVAAFRVVQPAAGLNQLVMTSFTTLYMPVASRLLARADREGVADLYWRTAIWMAVLSFPLFALTFSLAEPMTVALYGERYRSSATFLALLSLAQYVNVALGFNGLTLRVFGVLKYIVAINVVAAVANLAINLAFIPVLGALGAAIGTSSTLILHNVLKQAGLRLGTGINLFEWRYLRIYLVIAAAASVLGLSAIALRPDLLGALILAGVATLVVFLVNRRALQMTETFPELMRLPFAGLLFGAGPRRP